MPHSVHAGPVVPQVLAQVEVLVRFLMQRSKQPTFPHDVDTPQVLAHVEVLVLFAMQVAKQPRCPQDVDVPHVLAAVELLVAFFAASS